jgi:hypothetical protein
MSTQMMPSYNDISEAYYGDEHYETITGLKITDITTTAYYNNGIVVAHLDNLVLNENNNDVRLSSKDYAAFALNQLDDNTILSIPNSITFSMINNGIDAYATEQRIDKGFLSITSRPGGNVNIFGITYDIYNQVFVLDTDFGRQFFYTEDINSMKHHISGCSLEGMCKYRICYADLNAEDKRSYVFIFVLPYLIHLYDTNEIEIKNCNFGFMPQLRSITTSDIVLDRYSVQSMMTLSEMSVAKYYFERIVDQLLHTHSGGHMNAVTGGTILQYALQAIDQAQKTLNDYDMYNKFVQIWDK